MAFGLGFAKSYEVREGAASFHYIPGDFISSMVLLLFQGKPEFWFKSDGGFSS